jgi:integrase
MAHLRNHPVSGRPQVRWRDPLTGKEHTKTFRSSKQAREFKTRVEYELVRGTYIDPRGAKTRFGEWVDEWTTTWLHLRPNTVLQRESLLRSHVLPFFGDLPLGQITQPQIQSWVNALHSAGYAPWTIDNAYRVLKGALDAAVVTGLLAVSPCLRIRKPSPHSNRKEMHFLTPDELSRLADAMAEEFRALVLVTGWLGLRWGEVRGLRKKRIDLLRKELWVQEQLVEPQGHLQFAPLKTEASRRRLPLPDFVADVLREHLARRPGGPEGLVFASREGAALRDSWIRRHFKPAVLSAELPATFRFHDLRHTCAALLIRQGAGEYEVQRFLGHASPRTTGDNYSHLFDGFETRLSGRLQELYETTAAACQPPVADSA